ncbi:MAG TPA: hypothetical protein VMN38_12225 [Sphingomicrobium sp.]|nr:hypothetical protein [Sphingomicrobium sp.]
MTNIDPAIASLVLDAVSDDDFEVFSQALLGQVLGIELEPTGGMHDGGQDGFFRPLRGRPTHFVQISTQPKVKAKILSTIERQRSVGRGVEDLTYVSNRNLPNRDILEGEIEKSTGVGVRIRDRRWITIQMQRDDKASALFADRFAPLVHSVLQLHEHRTQIYTPSERMSILSYMEVHSASEPGENDLLTLAVDSAIYQALEGTDPEKGIFRSEDEVSTFVEKRFPASKKRSALDVAKRLSRLSSKTGVPRIRYHPKESGYCLPFEVRSDFSDHSLLLRNLEVAFWEGIKGRAREIGGLADDEVEALAEIAAHAINRTFEKQGLNLMASLKGATTFEEIKTFEFIAEKTGELIASADRRDVVEQSAAHVLRNVFYSGTIDEKEFLFRLFKAFSIEFVIKGDDRVGTYFAQMTRGLALIVGSDILVRALSETCVRPENQATQNALRMLSKAGATLILAESVLDEVYGNIHAADLEFENFYEPWEAKATLPEVQQSDRILIRAYFYSKFEPDRHAKSCASWDEFLSLFGEAGWFRRAEGKEAFATYLLRKFGMRLISRYDVEAAVPARDARALKDKIQKYKKDERLAWNDAYLALYVNERRRARGEKLGDSVYGFQSWWLTEEFKVLGAAREMGIRDILNMHPQFLMNLYAASPGMS